MVSELTGHSIEELGQRLQELESSMRVGQKARVTLCTDTLKTMAELNEMYSGMLATGSHVSRPICRVISGIPTTQFSITKGSPALIAIIPILVPLFTIGLIAFGVARIGEISKALLPLVITVVLGVIGIGLILRAPATKYIERGGTPPRLPATSKKALAASCR